MPRIKKFKSIEELKDFLFDNDLPFLDSQYSHRYISMQESTSTIGLDLNSWWVMTPANWTCPSCKREKLEILRPNQHNYLTGHLHEHHDHMADYLDEAFRNFSSNNVSAEATPLGAKFIARTSYALSAYDRVVICSDCNSADAQVKKLLKLPKEFSFSPFEIEKFIQVFPNKPHEIILDKAELEWRNCELIFQSRIDLIDKIAEIAALNNHWYQPVEKPSWAIKRRAESQFDRFGLKDLSFEPEKLLYKTNQFKGKNDSWRNKGSGQGKAIPPSSGDIRTVEGLSKWWSRVPEEWDCPVCFRSKIECIKRSNTGKWAFVLTSRKVFYDANAIEKFSEIMVCDDCNNSATNASKEVLKDLSLQMEFSSKLITPEELREIIIPSPHKKHQINSSIYDNLKPILIARVENELSHLVSPSN